MNTMLQWCLQDKEALSINCFYITYMANLSASTKIETFMITVCWIEFHIKYTKQIYMLYTVYKKYLILIA